MNPYAYVQDAPCGTILVRNVLAIRQIIVDGNSIFIDHARSAAANSETDIVHKCTESYELADAEQRPVLSFIKETDYAQMIASIEGL